jgi:uncharacterized protein YegL
MFTSTEPMRETTESFKSKFKGIEENEPIKTNLKYIHTDCWCGFDIDKHHDIAITNCGHQCHKWCMQEYLDKETTCFMCRQEITTISNLEWGINSISEFIKKCEIEDKLKIPKTLRQMTTGCCLRQITCDLEESYDDDISFETNQLSRSKKNGINLEPIPLEDDCKKLTTNEISANLFNTNPFKFGLETIGTCIFSAPYQESITTQLQADITIILDISGSMYDERIESCKKAIKMLLNVVNGKKKIRLTLITFDDYAVQEFALQNINSTNFDNISNIIDKITSFGGTDYNVAFRLLDNILTNRDSIVFFFSDGEPYNAVNLTILHNIYEKYPQLTMYVISIGADVDANKALIPLLCDRYHELAVYRHFSELDTFPEFIGNIIGETNGIYAYDITFIFEGVVPISSKCETDENGISKINVPLLRYNDISTFAFTQQDTELPISIIVHFTVDDEKHTINSKLDTENLIDLQLSRNFPIKRYLDRKCNTIRSRTDLTNKIKKDMFENILSEITEENLGPFYNDFRNGLINIIYSFEKISTRNNNLSNNIAQLDNSSSFIGRDVSLSTSRQISLSTP